MALSYMCQGAAGAAVQRDPHAIQWGSDQAWREF
jgi:hypothetical protein